MSELNNKYLDFSGLQKYDERIKAYIGSADQKLSEELTALIIALDEKIGNLEIEGSDDKNLSEIVADIYSSINDIIDAQDKLSDKDGELEEEDKRLAELIAGVRADLEWVTGSNSDNEATLGDINIKLNELEGLINKNIEDIKGIASAAETAGNTAGEAKSIAEAAQAEAQGATGTAGEAKSIAQAAQAEAEAATGTADEAKSAAEAAQASAEAAAGQAQTSAEAAQAAQAESQAAAGQAQASAEAAQAAQASAEAAAGQAQASAEAAQAAETTANNANEVAGQAKTTAEAAQAEAQGATVTAGQAKSIADENKGLIEGLTKKINGLDVKYDINTKYIHLYDENNNEIGSGFDASAFITDGMIKDVDFVDGDGSDSDESKTTLRFTFNTDAGDKVIDVDFSDYVDVYRADNTSIELDSTTNTFSVKEVAASKTKIGQKITIAGGPLANNIEEQGDIWPAKWKNGNEKFIPEDATVYDIVMNLFCVEKWPTNVTTSDASLASTIIAPSVKYNGKTSHGSSSTVEVGTTVSYEISNGASGNTATPHKASGFTYGYSAAADNSKDSGSGVTSVSATFNGADGKTTVAVVGDSVPTLTISGVVSDTVNGTTGSAAAGSATKSGNVVIAAGDNKISAKCKSVTYSGTCSELPVYYGCSNLGNTDTNGNGTGTTYPSTNKSEVTLTSTAVESSVVTINCVGAYKYFYGYPSSIPTSKSDIIALSKSGFLSGNELSVTTAGTVPVGKYMIVAVPNGWEYTSFVNGMYLDDISAFYTDTTEVDYTLDNNEVVKYSVHWCGPFGADTNYNSFKITKK